MKPNNHSVFESLEGRSLFSAGNLDPTFGTGGLVTQNVGSATKNGKSAWGLAMIKPSGALDVTFNGNGKKVLPLGGTVSQEATSIAFQPEGMLVVAGTGSLLSGKSDFMLIRFNPNGDIDGTFGTGLNGVAYADFGGTSDYASAVDIGSDGRIVVAGTKTFADGKSDIALSRHIGKPQFVGIFATDDTAVEGSDSNVGVFRLRRFGDLTQTLTVKLARSGTAGSSDYSFNTTFPVTFAAGQSELFIQVKAKADSQQEPTETVKLTILADPFYTASGGEAFVNIQDAN